MSDQKSTGKRRQAARAQGAACRAAARQPAAAQGADAGAPRRRGRPARRGHRRRRTAAAQVEPCRRARAGRRLNLPARSSRRAADLKSSGTPAAAPGETPRHGSHQDRRRQASSTARIPISGAKNAALPLMIASLLTDETLTLENVPHLADVEQLIRILGNHGVDYSVNGRRESAERRLFAHHQFLGPQHRRHDRALRAGLQDAGELLGDRAAAWRAWARRKVSLPGGCAIGTRPVDLFLDGLQALGAEIDVDNGYVIAKAQGRPADRQPLRLPESLGRRHACADDGGDARPGRDGARERRARAGGRQPRRLPERHGRARSRAPAPRRSPSTASTRSPGARASGHPRPHRDRHLCHGGGDGRRRRDARRRAAPTCCRRRST